ncbi:hypothetical protein [Absidia glauca]|uniref:Endonuclease/exonuclease/phosphatase domain-containing protein n=1 Tax=Absidia glauca TaxID=4829 RepID=A0A163J5X4_ABSGL|nr:hypothetical protein [Absidia glauca]
MRKQQALARSLAPPSTNQGYQYLYLTTRIRQPIGQLRKTFRGLNIESNRIIDLHYPTNNTLAILVHNDYVGPFTKQMTDLKLDNFTDFDPTDPQHIKNPIYQDRSLTERTHQAAVIVNARMTLILMKVRQLQLPPSKKQPNKCSAPLKPSNSPPQLPTHPQQLWIPMSDTTLSLININGLHKNAIHDLLQHTPTSDLLFITETWLSSPNKYNTNWKQHHTYGVPTNTSHIRHTLGIALLINPAVMNLLT